MKDIITKLELLEVPSKPIEFLTESGIQTSESDTIINKLKEIMENNKNILALSAPQIGINKRIFCIRFDDAIKVFINPIITKKSKYIIAPETSASLPNKEILIMRPEEISIIYYNDKFKYEDNKLLGPAARIFDQQIQFLDGITPAELGLISDINEDCSLADLTPDEAKQITAIYKQYIQTKLAAINKVVDIEDDEIKKQYRHLKFTEDVINDRIQVISDEPIKPKLNRATRRGLAKSVKKAKQKLGQK